ncbi:GHKL domain-containing protein [Photobacterium gaetbulicola]|uniref:histidine kinase n=1 Tax=Photobacterium gaetbulicola Gung47 TaxID=658445 RepID=A0A0C5X1R3_9GAMM|nr:ATP-binding protein [Photobacterium gaetbulicola]AJR09250.1 putative sensor histidine kinase [Photobacterium gaetbulicola Gung47]PSU11704.1 GHKL domain-containing protein [Photobacterium gaetbulicola]
MHQPKAMQRIIDVYFRDPARTEAVKAGTQVLVQDGYNDKLYWVKKGELSGYLKNEADVTARVFRVEQGMFFGVHSFFAQTLMASTTVVAEKDSEIAWIDLKTQPVEPETFGSLAEQFMPVMVHELAQRQMMTGLQAIEKEKALQKLYAAEQMTTLGQLAAGIAHELNNAVGVLSSKTEGLQQGICRFLEENKPEVSPFLDLGICDGQAVTSAQARKRAKQLEQDLTLQRDQARQLARAVPEGDIPDYWLDNLDDALQYWDIGRDLHDMKLAAKHAASIVRSVKQLGGTDNARQPEVDVNDTIHKSLALLQSNLRRVNVVLRPAVLPTMTASTTELVQVWVNIIKNACDAMEHTAEPQIEIITRHSKNRLLITISNNGPMIDEATRRKVFQPNFTTKKGGLSFGLGLGLSIVQRIVNSYGGTIALKSDLEKTKFRIKLPIA